MRALLSRLSANREAQIVLAFGALNALAGLVANRLLTQWVAPGPLGELYLYMNLGLWLTLPASAGYLYVSRHWGVARERRATAFFSRGLRQGIIWQALFAGLGVVVFGALHVLSAPWWALLALFVHCCAWATVQLLSTIQSLERRRVIAGVLDLSTGPMRQVALGAGALLALRLLNLSLSGDALMVVQAGHSVVLGLAVFTLFALLMRRIAKQDKAAPDPAPEAGAELTAKSAFHYAFPFLITAVATQIATSSERFGLARRADLPAIALFVQSVGLSTAMAGAGSQFLTNYFTPLIAQASARPGNPLKNAARLLRTYLSLAAVALLGLAIVVGFFPELLTSVFFGPRYARIAPLLPLTTLGAACFSLAQALSIVPYVTRDSVKPNVARVLSLVVYSTALLLVPLTGRIELGFARLFAGCQGVYLLLSVAVACVELQRSRRLGTHTEAP
jgi:O-antigen/teichoic acid export membrane protein